MNTQTIKTTAESKAVTKPKDTVKTEQAQKAKFLNEREREALNVKHSATKSGNITGKYGANYVRTLVNKIAKIEAEKKGTPEKREAVKVLGEFKNGDFGRLPEATIKYHTAAFARATSPTGKKADAKLEFYADDVKRDIMRMANKIWNSGSF